MKKILLVVFLAISNIVCAENKIYNLNPAFNGASEVEFVSVINERGETLKGYLKNGNGEYQVIPDACGPEGGRAELIDVYTVMGKANYLSFTCVWSVKHLGIGLNGSQYETFIYVVGDLVSVVKQKKLSEILSGYEGVLEGGDRSYAWYVPRNIASKKILEIEEGNPRDSLMLAHAIILARLKDGDYEAIKHYLAPGCIQQFLLDFPVNESTVVAYNDFGYALGKAGGEYMAYVILKEVEKAFPGRVVLKLNIAEVLWGADSEKSKMYYKEYVQLMREAGKEKLIPISALERINYK